LSKVCLEIQLIRPRTKYSDRKPGQIIENAMDCQHKNLEIVPIDISISLKTPRFRDIESRWKTLAGAHLLSTAPPSILVSLIAELHRLKHQFVKLYDKIAHLNRSHKIFNS
jgi:hypothetical protein